MNAAHEKVLDWKKFASEKRRSVHAEVMDNSLRYKDDRRYGKKGEYARYQYAPFYKVGHRSKIILKKAVTPEDPNSLPIWLEDRLHPTIQPEVAYQPTLDNYNERAVELGDLMQCGDVIAKTKRGRYFTVAWVVEQSQEDNDPYLYLKSEGVIEDVRTWLTAHNMTLHFNPRDMAAWGSRIPFIAGKLLIDGDKLIPQGRTSYTGCWELERVLFELALWDKRCIWDCFMLAGDGGKTFYLSLLKIRLPSKIRNLLDDQPKLKTIPQAVHFLLEYHGYNRRTAEEIFERYHQIFMLFEENGTKRHTALDLNHFLYAQSRALAQAWLLFDACRVIMLEDSPVHAWVRDFVKPRGKGFCKIEGFNVRLEHSRGEFFTSEIKQFCKNFIWHPKLWVIPEQMKQCLKEKTGPMKGKMMWFLEKKALLTPRFYEELSKAIPIDPRSDQYSKQRDEQSKFNRKLCIYGGNIRDFVTPNWGSVPVAGEAHRWTMAPYEGTSSITKPLSHSMTGGGEETKSRIANHSELRDYRWLGRLRSKCNRTIATGERRPFWDPTEAKKQLYAMVPPMAVITTPAIWDYPHEGAHRIWKKKFSWRERELRTKYARQIARISDRSLIERDAEYYVMFERDFQDA